MPKKAILLKSLTRGRIRTSFNKYNLFNLYKKGQIDFRTKSIYQQKWTAKQETRAYHGEHLTEGRWSSIFQSKLDSVAQLDASLRRDARIKETPFLLQTYAALEKRLDFAVFRAMFSSSVRQARQFILHGNVTVNGIQICHPGYILKPGDVFHVKPQKVLQALGAKKPSLEEAIKVDKKQLILWNKYVKEAKTEPKKVWENKINKFKNMPDSNPKKQDYLEFVKNYKSKIEKIEKDEVLSSTPKKFILNILKVQKSKPDSETELDVNDFKLLVDKDESLAPEVFKAYQELVKSGQIDWEIVNQQNDTQLKELSANLISFTPEMKDNLSDHSKSAIRSSIKILSELSKNYTKSIREYYKILKTDSDSNTIPFNSNWARYLTYHEKVDFDKVKENEKKYGKLIKLPWQDHPFGRKEPNRPYFTPWKPRPFLAPFTVLPHHLEISFKTCHAVYLRDPIARPGHSEVLSPFDLPVHERAYMYYVRRGK